MSTANGIPDLAVAADDDTDDYGRVFVYLGEAAGIDESSEVELEDTNPSSWYGKALAGAGDIDGDGYDDVIVGEQIHAHHLDGQALVFRGSATGVESTASQTLGCEDGYSNCQVGASVAGGADLDGDGYDDVVVGAPGFSDERGRAYVYYGSASGLDGSRLTKLKGAGAYQDFGDSVAMAGDIDGDGYPDVVVGAPEWEDDGESLTENHGRAYAYLGSADGVHNMYAIDIPAPDGATNFGEMVRGLGDTDGDGAGELAVKLPDGDAGTSMSVYIYPGSSSSPAETTPTALQEQTDDELGAAMAVVGDVNGDGYDDVLLSAGGYGHDRGELELFNGSASGLADTPDWTLTGSVGSQQLGRAIAAAGDVDGDGYADVLVSSAATVDQAAHVDLYRGSATGLGTDPDLTLVADDEDESFGSALAAGGDLNGDGYLDVAVGAWEAGSETGRVAVYLGSAAGLPTSPDLELTGESAGDRFGDAVAIVGDLNGDGFDDLAAGALRASGLLGRVYVYLGSAAGPSTTPDVTLRDSDLGSFGAELSGAGDLNGDGYDDLVVGIPTGAGRVDVFRGYASGVYSSPILQLDGTVDHGFLGCGVQGVGDLNRDGYDDLAVGLPYDDSLSSPGQVAIYRGAASGPSDVASGTLDSDEDDSLACASLDGGDIDGDGHPDVVVAVSTLDDRAGRAYLYRGGTGTTGDTGDAGDTGADGGAADGGASDGGALDGGALDGGASDGGASDGGAFDGGSVDGGSVDGGSVDGGASDSGTADGGAGGGTDTGGTNVRLHAKTGCSTVPAAGASWLLALLGLAGLSRRRQ